MHSRLLRSLQVSVHCLRFGVQLFIRGLLLREGPAQLGRVLRVHLEELGGVYPVLGTALAGRHDLFPSAFCDELRKARGFAVPFETAVAVRTIERELGKSIDELFATFDRNPVQVSFEWQRYFATISEEKPVIVSVRRPSLLPALEEELAILRVILWLLHFAGLFGRCHFGHEFEALRSWMLARVSPVAQGLAADRMAAQGAGNGREYISHIYWSHTAEEVLTAERLPGVPLSELLDSVRGSRAPVVDTGAGERIDVIEVARNLFYNHINQVSNGQYFCLTPDLAGLVVMPGNVIGHWEFSAVARTSGRFFSRQSEFLSAFRDGDVDGLFEAVLRSADLPDDTDIPELERRFKQRISRWLDLRDWPNAPRAGRSPAALIEGILCDFRQLGVPLPGGMVSPVLVFSRIDAIIEELAPELDLDAEISTFIREKLTERIQRQVRLRRLTQIFLEYEELILQFPRQFRQVMSTLLAGQEPHAHPLNPWGLRGLKFARAACTALLVSDVLVWVWQLARPAGGPQFRLAPGLIGAAAVALLLLRRVSGIGYERLVLGRRRMRA